MSNKVCQICGQAKPAEAFSKSYPNRCRECVAEQARGRRQRAKINGKEARVIITDDPICNPLPDFIKRAKHQEPDWEQRRYDLALSIFLNCLYNEHLTPEQAAKEARDAADQFINIIKPKNHEEEISQTSTQLG